MESDSSDSEIETKPRNRSKNILKYVSSSNEEQNSLNENEESSEDDNMNVSRKKSMKLSSDDSEDKIPTRKSARLNNKLTVGTDKDKIKNLTDSENDSINKECNILRHSSHLGKKRKPYALKNHRDEGGSSKLKISKIKPSQTDTNNSNVTTVRRSSRLRSKNDICQSQDSDDSVHHSLEINTKHVKSNGKSKTVSSSDSETTDIDNSEYTPSPKSDSSTPKDEQHVNTKRRTKSRLKTISSSDSEHDVELETKNIKYTPSRQSPRLQEKGKRTLNKPNRKQILDAISPTYKGESAEKNQNILSSMKKQRTNNFIFEQNRYNEDTTYNLYDIDCSYEEDFIDDDEIEYSQKKQRVKSKRRAKRNHSKSRKSKKSLFDSDDDEVKKVDKSSSCDDSCLKRRRNINEDDHGDIDDKVAIKCTCGKNGNKDYIAPRKILTRKREKKHSKVLKKLEETRAAKQLPISQREYQKSEESDNESCNGNMYANICENSSDEDFIDDEGYGEHDDTSQSEKWPDALQNILLKFHNPTVEYSDSDEKKDTKFKRIKIDDSDSDETATWEDNLTSEEKDFFHNVCSDDVEGIKNISQLNKYTTLLYNKKYTALHIASMKGSREMVEVLVKHGADTKSRDSINFIPIAYAALHKFPDCFDCLLQYTDMVFTGRHLRKVWNGCNLLHLVVTISQHRETSIELETNIVNCIKVLKTFNEKTFRRLILESDDKKHTPLVTAMLNDQPEAVKIFLATIFKDDLENDLIEYPSEEGETFLHFAAQHSARCFAEVIPYFVDCVNTKDLHGFTPLMYAAELGKNECIEILLQNGSSMAIKDKDQTSPLHLAAAGGDLQSIEILLDKGHPVDCVDKFGWPPLLYANFKATQSCVIKLFKTNPNQIFCLSNLLHNDDVNQRIKNAKVIQETLMSIAHIDAYYTLFNDFISKNLTLLDDNNSGVFMKTWRMILSFENKVKWMRRKYNFWNSSTIKIDRENVLQSAIDQVHHSFGISGLDVRFNNEAGSCLGPKREFFDCLVNDITDEKKCLLSKNENQQYSLTPNSYFMKHLQTSLENIKLKEEIPIKDETNMEQNDNIFSTPIVANSTPADTSYNTPSVTPVTTSLSTSATTSATTHLNTSHSTPVTTPVNTSNNIPATTHVNTPFNISDDTPDVTPVNISHNTPIVISSQSIHTTPIIISSPNDSIDEISENMLDEEEMDISDANILVAANNIDRSFNDDANIPVAANNIDRSSDQFSIAMNLLTDHNTDQIMQGVDDKMLQKNNVLDVVKVKTFHDYKIELADRLEKIRFIGQIVSQVILSKDINMKLQLTKPFIKQILGIPLQHPEELEEVDHQLYTNIKDNEMDDLDLPFYLSYINPWNGHLEEIMMGECEDDVITDQNKAVYLEHVSKFKCHTVIYKELEEFKTGFYRSIRPEVISIFNADEFSLLLNGVSKIDLDEWKKYTKYRTWQKDSLVITWFWNAVEKLKTEEMSLLLKFATGSPCVPLGGFSNLQGLGGGITLFTIGAAGGTDRLPGASTCFNLLSLPAYSSEETLKEKLLIAIRHGCEGFAFG